MTSSDNEVKSETPTELDHFLHTEVTNLIDEVAKKLGFVSLDILRNAIPKRHQSVREVMLRQPRHNLNFLEIWSTCYVHN